MKRPSFQFYPSDWLRDTALRSCSIGARGLWIDMICYMHEGSPYGYLKVGNKVILPANLSRMTGITLQEVEGYLKELQEANVFEIDEEGSIYSRRMIRDESVRKSRAEGGKLGGNPNLKVITKVNHKVENKVNQNPTPSSSSSSSSSKDIYTPEFELFWKAYPQGGRTGKGGAWNSWKKIKPDDSLVSQIIKSINLYSQSQKVKDNFIKNPQTWLNQKCWEDEVVDAKDKSNVPPEWRV
jgi:hypothetical protein